MNKLFQNICGINATSSSPITVPVASTSAAAVESTATTTVVVKSAAATTVIVETSTTTTVIVETAVFIYSVLIPVTIAIVISSILRLLLYQRLVLLLRRFVSLLLDRSFLGNFDVNFFAKKFGSVLFPDGFCSILLFFELKQINQIFRHQYKQYRTSIQFNKRS